MPNVFIYTDGACSGNPGPGGYGTILTFGKHEKEMSEGYQRTTNNRMELMAVVKGLEALKQEGLDVTVVTDSKYVCDAFLKNWIAGWKKKNFKNVKNLDLWKVLIALTSKHKVQWQWVKGHAGHPMNERCDQLAVLASQNPRLKDVGFTGGSWH